MFDFLGSKKFNGCSTRLNENRYTVAWPMSGPIYLSRRIYDFFKPFLVKQSLMNPEEASGESAYGDKAMNRLLSRPPSSTFNLFPTQKGSPTRLKSITRLNSEPPGTSIFAAGECTTKTALTTTQGIPIKKVIWNWLGLPDLCLPETIFMLDGNSDAPLRIMVFS